MAGQMVGVEGYVESAASGLVAGLNAARLVQKKEPLVLPRETAIGSLSHYITSTSADNFQPMNINFGIMEPLGIKIKNKKERAEKYAERALNIIQNFSQSSHN
jgi:methylenetetrahydrofolate--tRNA-(uracil-5-)-methyltransferase